MTVKKAQAPDSPLLETTNPTSFSTLKEENKFVQGFQQKAEKMMTGILNQLYIINFDKKILRNSRQQWINFLTKKRRKKILQQTRNENDEELLIKSDTDHLHDK